MRTYKFIFGAMLFVFGISANAACNTASLKGNYIVSANYTGYKEGYPTNCGDIGLIIFDGKGTAKAIGYESCAGQTYSLPVVNGAYFVDQVCSGEVTFPNVVIKFIFDKNLKSGVVLGGNEGVNSSGIGTITKQ